MHEELTGRVIGCAIEVHRHLGPGLLEAVYEEALCVEMDLQGIKYERQTMCSVDYKGKKVGDYRLDLLVEGSVVVEIKSASGHDPVFDAQVLTYLRITGKHVGLLINFNKVLLKEGVTRFVL